MGVLIGLIIALSIIVPWVIVLIMVGRSKGGYRTYIDYYRRRFRR